MLIQLINTSGDHANRYVKGIDEIPVLTNLKVSVNISEKPRKVLLQPEGKLLKFDFTGNKVSIVIPELKIHDIVEIVK